MSSCSQKRMVNVFGLVLSSVGDNTLLNLIKSETFQIRNLICLIYVNICFNIVFLRFSSIKHYERLILKHGHIQYLHVPKKTNKQKVC